MLPLQPAPSDELHDAGGKSRLRLKPDVVADAVFYDNRRYRTILTRRWTEDRDAPFVLWIGMNPSVASFDVDDPTCAREQEFTRRWGYASYVKCNIMDACFTEQKRLRDPDVIPCSEHNLPAIRDQASRAAMIVLGFGAVHPSLQHYADAVCQALVEDGRRLWCLKLTKNGNAGHPLYIAGDTKPVPYAPKLKPAV
ncbi:DUF1643 domain-containing protein [Microvirga sp. BT688]|uniref:DUF1643 domain-containing protein n=1 Tax=Microvirga sp. TaxID=1873136 RepID=UPI0016886151|nr:DUF1643 domain-containing protein [Microvirga sp.]MBD2746139.1 DUF1643 domain-containing protein [Microvirga sp.]